MATRIGVWWPGKWGVRARDRAGNGLGGVIEGDGGPTGVNDVHEHQRVVVGQVDVDVVRRVVGPVPGKLDTLAADPDREAVLEGLLWRGPRRGVVPQQQVARLLVADPGDVGGE